MKYCSNCGNKLNSKDKFCASCGKENIKEDNKNGINISITTSRAINIGVKIVSLLNSLIQLDNFFIILILLLLDF